MWNSFSKPSMIHARKINTRLLAFNALTYRVFITTAEILFLKFITGSWNMAIKGGVIWNILNIILYYIYHYLFAKFFKLGVNGN